jgi:seryl-tRNA(Sec) selenium transferase
MSFPSVTAERAETLLHLRELPVVARVSRDCLLLSVRTLFEEDLPEVVEAVRELYALPMGRER